MLDIGSGARLEADKTAKKKLSKKEKSGKKLSSAALSSQEAPPEMDEAQKEQLGRECSGAIHFHQKKRYKKARSDGADINFWKKGEKVGKGVNTPIAQSIMYRNPWAFDDLMAQENIELNQPGLGGVVPLFCAAEEGYTYAVRALLAPGRAEATAYCSKTALSPAINFIHSGALIEMENATWNTDEPNAYRGDSTLQTEIEAFFNQEGAYATSDVNVGVPFRELSKPLEVCFRGKLDIIEMLLDKGVDPTKTGRAAPTSPLELAQTPELSAFCFHAGEREKLEYLDCKGSVLRFSMKFWNRTRVGTPIDIIVHYDLGPACHLMEEALKRAREPHDGQFQAFLRIQEEQSAKIEAQDKRIEAQVQQIQTIMQPEEDERRFNEWLGTHENLKQFHRTVLIAMENLFIGVGSVASEEVDPTAGALHSGAAGLNAVGGLLGATIVGAPIEKICNALAAVADVVDTKRQTNKAKSAANLGTLKEKMAWCQEVAKVLTECLQEPLLTLLTASEAQEEQQGSAKNGLKKAQKAILASNDFSPAEQVGLFAYALIRDEIHRSNPDTTKSVPERLVSAVLERPAEESGYLQAFTNIGLATVPMRRCGGSEYVQAFTNTGLATVAVPRKDTIVFVSPQEILREGKRPELSSEGSNDSASSDTLSHSSSTGSSSGGSSAHSVSSSDLSVRLQEQTVALEAAITLVDDGLQMPPRSNHSSVETSHATTQAQFTPAHSQQQQGQSATAAVTTGATHATVSSSSAATAKPASKKTFTTSVKQLVAAWSH